MPTKVFVSTDYTYSTPLSKKCHTDVGDTLKSVLQIVDIFKYQETVNFEGGLKLILGTVYDIHTLHRYVYVL